jgi:rRNA pseudouridine-1189 N-methylase Emg1 (Nep1/Mra1 family)
MSDYKTKFEELRKTLEESSELLEMEYQRLDEEMREAIKTGEGAVMALKELSFHLGKMKMLQDVKCLVLGMMTEGEKDSEIERTVKVSQLEAQYLDQGITQGIV